MESILHDLRYACRTLVKRPGFTLVALFTLALGIGGGTMMFTVANAIVLRPFPFLDTDGLIVFANAPTDPREPIRPLTLGDVRAVRARTDLFAAVGEFQAFYFNDPGEGRRPEQLFGQIVRAGFFEALGERPMLGRTIQPADAVPGNDNVVVLSHRLWHRRFGGDSTVIGRRFPLEGRIYRVIGVMPEAFSYPANSELWGAMQEAKTSAARDGYFAYDAIARLRPGKSIDDVTHAFAPHRQQTARDGEREGSIVARLMLDESVQRARGPVAIMSVAVGLVLLIACTNVANLLMSRSAARRRELAVRAALGARRSRIVRGLLIESIVLALLGGGLGVLLAMLGIELLATAIPADLTKQLAGWSHISVDGTALLFTLGVSTATGILFGILPALRSSKPDLTDALKESSTMVLGGRRGAGFRNGLVIVEVAVALVLLVGAVLLIRAYLDIRLLDRGYTSDGVIAVEVSLPDSTYPKGDDVANYVDRAVGRIAMVSGVKAVSVVAPNPASSMMATGYFRTRAIAARDTTARRAAGFLSIGGDYFDVMRIPLLAGRTFHRREEISDSRSIMIDARMARTHFATPHGAIGQHIVIGNDTTLCEIVGVVGDVRGVYGELPGDGTIYIPFGLVPRRTTSIVVLVDEQARDQTMKEVAAAMGKVDPNQAISVMRSMDDLLSTQLVGRSLVTIAIALFAIVALLLAAVGIYSVIAYTVAQRTHEIGLRMALGADERRVLGLMVQQGMMPVMIGVGVGLAIAIGVGASLLELVIGATPADPLTYIVVAAGLLAVALLACYIPARRAVHVDPVVALRYE